MTKKFLYDPDKCSHRGMLIYQSTPHGITWECPGCGLIIKDESVKSEIPIKWTSKPND